MANIAGMYVKIAVLILALAFYQVPAENVEVDFIENVLKKEETRGTRILSGWEAVPGQHPHQTSLRMVDRTGGVSACGGSVIHSEWVMTSAHCTATRVTIVIRAGVTCLTSPVYLVESTEWYNYPTYIDAMVTAVQPNDIALVKLPYTLTFSDLLKPIRLQSRADAYRDYTNELTVASGYGRTWTNGGSPEILNWVYLRGVSQADCRGTFPTVVTENTICARFFNVTSQSTCQGDSGGPLVHEDSEGVPILIGVTSFVAGGDWGCHSGLPAGFIRPGPFHDWLTDVTGIDFENLDSEEPTTTEAPTTTVAPTTTEALTTTEAPITTEAPTTTESPTTTEAPDTDEDDDSEEDEEISELLKRLQVKVLVKVKVDKFKKIKTKP